MRMGSQFRHNIIAIDGADQYGEMAIEAARLRPEISCPDRRA